MLPITCFAASASHWLAEDLGFGLRYRVHGQKVHGHEFGFIQKYGHCDYNILWLSLSTVDKQIHQDEGDEVDIRVSANGEYMKLSTTVLATDEYGPLTHIASFSNYVLDTQLAELLGNADNIVLKVVGPKDFADFFDTGNGTFDISGIRQVASDATDQCRGHPKSMVTTIPGGA